MAIAADDGNKRANAERGKRPRRQFEVQLELRLGEPLLPADKTRMGVMEGPAAGRFNSVALIPDLPLGRFRCDRCVVTPARTSMAFLPGDFGQKPMQPVTHDGWRAVGEEQNENDQTLGHFGALTRGSLK